MKKIAIVLQATLLALAILTASACASGIPGVKDTGEGSGDNTETGCEIIYGRLCTEARNAAVQHSNWIFFIESGRGSEAGAGSMQIRRGPAGLMPPAPAGSGNFPGKIRPAFDNGQNGQQHPFFEKENLKNREMLDREELNRFLEDQNRNNNLNQMQNFRQEDGAYYQAYVTPDADAVKDYLEENCLDDKYEIYEAALSWIWVSDETLHGAEEKWLTPAEFLEETPDYAKNPVSGEPVSDCEEQAHALASLLIASGEYDESSVRVAVGEVNFGEASGGHAWVEVFEDGSWFPLDATGGPYYDDGSSELLSVDVSEIDYEEYRDSSYPVVEVWYYYNNEYFVDLGNQRGTAPVSWQKLPESYQGSPQTRSIRPSRL